MAHTTEEKLQMRIEQLEREVRDREADLAKFRDELIQANRRLEGMIHAISAELKIAHTIQRTLVPTDFPNIPGFDFSTKFVPSSRSGGDYFDFFEHQDKFRFGIVLSSASAYGMSALLLSVLLKMTSKLEARKGADPHLVVQAIAQEMLSEMEADSKTDLFYGLVDRRSYELRFLRLGNVMAIHQPAETGEFQILEASGGPLEPNFKAPKESKKIMLNAKDRVILFTRGILETTNARGETFGLEHVTRALLSAPKRGVHELRNHLLYEAQKFSQGQEPPRDLTVLILEVKDKVIKLAKS
jgi:sigma-B regulation protein RsbU (phosphoserine phosphatase)